MTLGSWFRDYVYIPMGGNRKGLPRLVLNLCCLAADGAVARRKCEFPCLGHYGRRFVIPPKAYIYGKWLSRHRVLSHVYVWIIIPLTWVILQ